MGPRVFTSSLHETKAKMLRDAGVDFSAAARESRKRFHGYWIIRFENPDREEAEALKRIKDL